MTTLMFALGCATPSGMGSGTADDEETPTATWVSPREGDTVEAGDVPLSIAVEHFLLVDPAKHEDDAPEGTLRVSWTDGTTADSLDTASTTPTILLASAGTWTLAATLILADGDEVTEAFPEFAPAVIEITAVIAAE